MSDDSVIEIHSDDEEEIGLTASQKKKRLVFPKTHAGKWNSCDFILGNLMMHDHGTMGRINSWAMESAFDCIRKGLAPATSVELGVDRFECRYENGFAVSIAGFLQHKRHFSSFLLVRVPPRDGKSGRVQVFHYDSIPGYHRPEEPDNEAFPRTGFLMQEAVTVLQDAGAVPIEEVVSVTQMPILSQKSDWECSYVTVAAMTGFYSLHDWPVERLVDYHAVLAAVRPIMEEKYRVVVENKKKHTKAEQYRKSSQTKQRKNKKRN